MQFEASDVPVEKLPIPAGWRLLIAPVKIEQTSKGGIVIVDEAIKTAEYFRNTGKVLAMGPECYQHSKFNRGIPVNERTPVPWCRVGDIVQFSSYTGAEQTIVHDGKLSKVKFINDDEVISVISDPSILEF